MKNIHNPTTLISKIRDLLNELEVVMKHSVSQKRKLKQSSHTKNQKGVMGGINTLIEKGFFNKPKSIQMSMKGLNEIGRYDKPETVSMNLLNLTKNRRLNRFKNKKTKKWEYVIRR